MHSYLNRHDACPPEVSIVVCTFNRADLLRQTLMSLQQQRIPGRHFEIVIIDDGSTDATSEVVEQALRRSSVVIRYVKQANAGIGNARNRGLEEARAPWVAFIDDDEVASDNWLSELLAVAETEDADCVGGSNSLRLLGPAEVEPVGTIAKLLGATTMMTKSRDEISCFDRLSSRFVNAAVPGGGNALVRKSLILEVGGFLPMTYGEDNEFFRRALRNGARCCVAPMARIYHLTPSHRLSPEYLYGLARKGGSSQAEIAANDPGVGRYYVSLFRLCHALFFVLPTLLWHAILQQRSQVVSNLCSVHFSLAYIGTVFRRTPAAAGRLTKADPEETLS